MQYSISYSVASPEVSLPASHQHRKSVTPFPAGQRSQYGNCSQESQTERRRVKCESMHSMGHAPASEHSGMVAGRPHLCWYIDTAVCGHSNQLPKERPGAVRLSNPVTGRLYVGWLQPAWAEKGERQTVRLIAGLLSTGAADGSNGLRSLQGRIYLYFMMSGGQGGGGGKLSGSISPLLLSVALLQW